MATLNARERRTFDALLDALVAGLPAQLHELLEEVPLIVEDEPSEDLLASLGFGPDDDLCGLHEGIALTDRSVEGIRGVEGGPDHMMLFRGPIMRVADWLEGEPTDELEEQIRITLLHEIGHHFGLDEDDLERLGYA